MTRLLYLEDPAAWRCECSLMATTEAPDGSMVELSVSPFYPRGGGQPSDTGILVGSNGRMEVRQVIRTLEGRVLHCGQMIEGQLAVGDQLLATIDRDVRLRHARLHTAGEVICAAVAELGRCWPVRAASHIPGQSRLAFATDLKVEELPGFMEHFKSQFAAIVARDEPVVTMNDVTVDEARRLCALDASSIEAKQAPLRLVSPVRGFFRPCKGAHLQRTSEIGEIVFRKSRLRDRELSISYALG